MKSYAQYMAEYAQVAKTCPPGGQLIKPQIFINSHDFIRQGLGGRDSGHPHASFFLRTTIFTTFLVFFSSTGLVSVASSISF